MMNTDLEHRSDDWAALVAAEFVAMLNRKTGRNAETAETIKARFLASGAPGTRAIWSERMDFYVRAILELQAGAKCEVIQ